MRCMATVASIILLICGMLVCLCTQDSASLQHARARLGVMDNQLKQLQADHLALQKKFQQV